MSQAPSDRFPARSPDGAPNSAGLDLGASSPATPLPAATVLVLRPGEAGLLEVFCVRRHTGIAFMGGAVVFPGGKLDPADRAVSTPVRSDPDPRGLGLLDSCSTSEEAATELRALAVAACREALEEAAIIPAFGGPTGTAVGAEDALRMREALEAGASLAAVLTERGASLDLRSLVPFARWVTPEAERRRYDARFFLLPLPEGQEGRHDDRETTQGFWDTPRGVLERFAQGEIQLAPPTTRSLEVLVEARTIAEATDLARSLSLDPICPQFVPADPPFLALPGDPTHPVGVRRVPGATRFVLRDGRFVGEDAPT